MSQLEITFSRAMYLDPDRLVEPPYRLYRVDGGDVRWYYCPEDGRYYPSVTSVIGATMPTPPHLVSWFKREGENADAIRDERGAYGMALHAAVEQIVVHGSISASDMETFCGKNLMPGSDMGAWMRELRKDCLGFIQMVQDTGFEPIAVEIMLRGDGYAGAADLIGVMGKRAGKIALLDVKGGKKGFYESHRLQLFMYKMAWDTLYPQLPIDDVYNFAGKDWRKRPTYDLKRHKSDGAMEKIALLLKHFEMDGHKPPRLLEFSDMFSLDGDVSTMFQFTEIKDKVTPNGKV